MSKYSRPPIGGANKKFGIDPHTILSGLFPPPGQSIGNNDNGQISRLDFLGFWTAVMGILPQEENPVVKQLCQQLQGRLKFMYGPKIDDGKKKKDKGTISGFDLLQLIEGNSHVNTNSIVTTLSFLIFAPFKFDHKILAQWYIDLQRAEYAMAVPDCVKNLAIFIKFRCLLDNVGWDDSEFKFDNKDQKIVSVYFEQLKQYARDHVTGSAGNIEINGDVFSPLIIAATKIIQTPWIPMLTLDEGDITSNECGFLFTYLSDVINQYGRDYQLALISSLFDRAHLISQGGAQPAIREQTFLAITHMVRCFFTQGAIINITLLRRGLLILQSFYLWQQPFGRVAESLILLIQYELLSPGYAFRTYLQRECNQVDYKSNIQNTNPSLSISYYGTQIDTSMSKTPHNGYQHNKSIFYLYDTNDRKAFSILSVIDPVEFDPSSAVPIVHVDGTSTLPSALAINDIENKDSVDPNAVIPPHPIMLMTILHALEIDCKFDSNDVINLKHLQYSQLIPFYTRLINMHHTLTASAITPTVAVRRQTFEAFKTELLTLAQSTYQHAQENNLGPVITTLPQYSEKHHRYAPSLPNIEHIHLGVEQTFTLGDKPGYPAVAAYEKLLSLFYAYVPASLDPGTNTAHSPRQPIREDTESSTSREEHNNNNISRIRNSSLYNGPVSINGKSEHSGIEKTSTIRNAALLDPPQSTKRSIRFAILGTAKFLHRIVTAYHKIILNHPFFFNYLDISFMLLPTGDNWLSNYLARNDLWYFRHVYAPLMSPALLIPWIRDEENTRLVTQANTIGQSYPCQYLRSSIIQYAQQALYTLPVTVYKVECCTDLRGTGTAITIYFVQRLELGTAVAIEEFKTSNPLVRHEDILSHKNFTSPTLDMSIGYKKCDLMGVTQPEVVEDGVQFQSFVLSNIPTKTANFTTSSKTATDVDDKDKKKKTNEDKSVLVTEQLLTGNQNDVTSTPDPTTTTLEAFISAPRADKSKLRPGSLLYDPKQHLTEIYFSSNVSFKIRVDGINYGLFKYIHVSPSTTTAGQISKFPIQTFFPVGQTQ